VCGYNAYLYGLKPLEDDIMYSKLISTFSIPEDRLEIDENFKNTTRVYLFLEGKTFVLSCCSRNTLTNQYTLLL
jgi:hypothetical protein